MPLGDVCISSCANLMNMKKSRSPIGTTVTAARRRRAVASTEYFREMKRLEPYEKLARVVIHVRIRHGLTQEQLADRLGTTASAISRLESGQHVPSMVTLRKLAHAYGGRLLLGGIDGLHVAE